MDGPGCEKQARRQANQTDKGTMLHTPPVLIPRNCYERIMYRTIDPARAYIITPFIISTCECKRKRKRKRAEVQLQLPID
jgi:hypothetical protein